MRPDFYTKGMACAICQTRRPRRYCPGVRGDICPICCGTEREVTVDCPLDCEYLQQARQHEKITNVEPGQIPFPEIQVSEKVMDENPALLSFLARTVLTTALSIPRVVDADVREALEALTRTYRTLESGVYYESVPANLLAAGLYRRLQEQLAEYRRQETQQLGVTKTRDGHVLAYLVFLDRVAVSYNSTRPRSRAFLSALMSGYGGTAAEDSPAGSPLLLP
jgi:hypothetical protein